MEGTIVSWFDLETCSEIIEDGAIGENTYDFLLVFYSNFDGISYRFYACYSEFYSEMTLLSHCDL